MTTRLEVNSAALGRALDRWLGQQGAQLADKGARKAALDVVAETQRAITAGLDGTPKRVDTGRYRGGWTDGARSAGISSGSLAPIAGGSGYGSVSGSGLTVTITVGNAVEYAPFVEYGTRTMEPGNHLTRALEVVRRSIPGETSRGSIREMIVSAWET